MFTTKIKDPHAFCATNKVVIRLKEKVAIMLLEQWLKKQRNTSKSMLPTYSHIFECERDLMSTLEINEVIDDLLVNYQNSTVIPTVLAMDTEQSVQSSPIETMLQSREVFIVENTLDLLVIFTNPTFIQDGTALLCTLKLYLRAITGKTICGMLSWVFEHVSSIVEGLFANVQSSLDDKYENPILQFRKIFEMWDSMKSHPLVKKLTTIFHYMLSSAMLDKFGITYDKCFFSKAEAEASQRTHDSKTGFFGAVIDGVLYIVERMYDVYRTGSWQPLLHTGSQYSQWVDEYYTLKEI